jgi:hypothetical protein
MICLSTTRKDSCKWLEKIKIRNTSINMILTSDFARIDDIKRKKVKNEL